MIEILKKVINLFGAENQENMCIEECAELIQAINKKHRELKHNIPEEIADVEITLEQLKIINCCAEEVERIKQNKLQRLSERLGAKMTDSKIIKALECCIQVDGDVCNVCPLYDKKSGCLGGDLRKPALDLINRQKAQLEKKDTEIDILIRKKETLSNEISELRAEIERVEKLQKPTETSGFHIKNGNIVFYTNILNGYRYEYKNLDEVVKELNLMLHQNYSSDEIISHYKGELETTKAENERHIRMVNQKQ